MPAAVFPRTIIPSSTTPLRVPTGLVSRGHTGKDQLRSVVAMGREWTESWDLIEAGDSVAESFLAWIEWAYNTSQVFTIQHLTTPGSGAPKNGSGTGTVLVLGASQTGESLLTDGWSINPVLKAGDVIRVAGLSPLLRITEDASHAGAQAMLKINPPIPVGSSPADGAAVTHTGCTLNAYIAAPPNLPDMVEGIYFAGLTLHFREAL